MNAYEQVIKHYGEVKQHLKAIEEMKELTKEINNYLECYKDNRQERISELADVYNMLLQLKIMWDVSEYQLQNEMEKKMQRTLERIKQEKLSQ